jgi:ferric-dicitrate binding protein FerR (iron transport regulator)
VQDAEARGWTREIERHRDALARLEALLTDLGEPLEGAETQDHPGLCPPDTRHDTVTEGGKKQPRPPG